MSLATPAIIRRLAVSSRTAAPLLRAVSSNVTRTFASSSRQQLVASAPHSVGFRSTAVSGLRRKTSLLHMSPIIRQQREWTVHISKRCSTKCNNRSYYVHPDRDDAQ